MPRSIPEIKKLAQADPLIRAVLETDLYYIFPTRWDVF